MILRRIALALRKRDWFTVVVEIMIVVLGVFIGLQVNNWNEARLDRGTVSRHLLEISEDLQLHLESHDRLYASAIARIAAVDYIHEAAFGTQLPAYLRLTTEDRRVPVTPEIAPDRLSNLMGAINLVRISVASRSGYESLISSGNLGLLENRDLARSIQLYYGKYDDLLDTNDVFRGFRNSGAALSYQFGVSVFDERPAEDLIALASEHPAFAAYLRSQREWAVVHAGLLEELRSETETLLAAIHAALGVRP
jgi:hypothetical protein